MVFGFVALHQLLCMLPLSMDHSSSDGIVIYYMLPVLCQYFTFCTVGCIAHTCIRKRREHNSRNYCINSNQMLLSNKGQQVHMVGCALGRSLVSMIALFNPESL